MKSPLLPKILDKLHTPPKYTGARPKAASKALDEWAWNHTVRLSRVELDKCAAQERKEELSTENETGHLTDFENLRYTNLMDKTNDFTPNLVRFLRAVGETKPKARNRRKENPGSTLEGIQPSFALFALFNECGYVTSYSWSTKAVKLLSESQIKKTKQMVLKHACFVSYDNLCLSKANKAQRGDRHTVTDNGTAMTVVQMPDSVKEIFMKAVEEDVVLDHTTPTMDPLAPIRDPAPAPAPTPAGSEPAPTNPDIGESDWPRSEASSAQSGEPAWDDFADFACYGRIAKYNQFLVFEIMFEKVPGLLDIPIRHSDQLLGPPPRHIMPSGKEHQTRYFMLGTVPIDELSVAGNIQVIEEILW
ncbi:hypothetical protein RhiTH_009759 [Rhizoctonia solani]